jgi:hypothetical protein
MWHSTRATRSTPAPSGWPYVTLADPSSPSQSSDLPSQPLHVYKHIHN